MKKKYEIIENPADYEIVVSAHPTCAAELQELAGLRLVEVVGDDPFIVFTFKDAAGTSCDLLLSKDGTAYLTDPY